MTYGERFPDDWQNMTTGTRLDWLRARGIHTMGLERDWNAERDPRFSSGSHVHTYTQGGGEAMTSKLGTYFQTRPETNAEGTELVKTCPTMWVRWIDADQDAPDNPFRASGNRVLARLYLPDRTEHEYMDRGAQGAVEYAERMKPRIERLKAMGIRDVGGPNEPHPTKATAPIHDAFWYKLTEIYWGRGMFVWGWDLGVGWLGLRRFGDETKAHIGMVSQTARSVDLMRQAGGGVVVHEYNAPSVINEGGNNGDSLTLRIKHALVEWGDAGVDVDKLSVIIGECGIDRGVMPGKSLAGWKSFNKWVYPEQYGLPAGVMNAERYWRQMSALDDAYCAIPQVVAAFPFVTNPNRDWASFDWNGDMIRRAVAKHGVVTPPVTPPVIVPPVVPPVTPPQLDVAELRQLAASLKSQLDGADDALRAAYITQAILEEMLG